MSEALDEVPGIPRVKLLEKYSSLARSVSLPFVRVATEGQERRVHVITEVGHALESVRRMKTIREQREERRQEKLNHMRRQIKAGKLVVRQMTAEEQANSFVFPRKLETSESAEGR